MGIVEGIRALDQENYRLKQALQASEEARAEALLAWSSLCELLGREHLEVQTSAPTSFPVTHAVTVTLHINENLIFHQRRREELINHIGDTLADLVRMVVARASAAEIKESAGDAPRRPIRVPVPYFGRHVAPPRW